MSIVIKVSTSSQNLSIYFRYIIVKTPKILVCDGYSTINDCGLWYLSMRSILIEVKRLSPLL